MSGPLHEGGGAVIESDANPMHTAHSALRCHAKAKTTGLPCKAPAVRGWAVCRMHGAGGGAPKGKRNGNWRHGGRTAEAVELRRWATELVREARDIDQLIRGHDVATTQEEGGEPL